MSERDVRADDVHALTALYALDAVTAAERDEAEQHLASCAPCRDDLQQVREALASAVPEVAPPAALRASVLAALDGVPQLPPLTGAPAVVAPAEVEPPVDELSRRRAARRRFLPALAAAAAAVVLAGAAGLGWAALDYRSDRNAARQAAVALGEVASAPDAVTVAAQTGGGGTAPGNWGQTRLVVSRSQQEAVLIADGTAAAPHGHVYQLWFIDGTVPRSAGTFDAGGSVTPEVLAGRVGSASAVAITVEPDGGSTQPTTPPVVTYSL